MQRKILVICLALVFIAPSTVWALGLGKVEVKSSLNQPLQAEIPILSARSRDLDNMTVKLAPPEMFERSNIRRSLFLSQLKFEIDKKATPPAIKVTSPANITDPFVVLILELNWANGRIMREFTLLIDPPRGLPLPRMRPQTDRQAPSTGRVARPTEDKGTTPREFTARPTTRAGSRLGTDYGTVRSGQTLWQIAKEVRGNETSMSTEQLLMALYRTNPQAFSNNNVNSLLAGRRLLVPTETEVSKVTTQQATAEFREHVRAWRRGIATTSASATGTADGRSPAQTKTESQGQAQGQPQTDGKTPAQPEKKGATSTGPAAQPEQAGPRLQVLAPSEQGDGTNALPSSVDELQSALIQSRDESDQVRTEKEQQAARLQAMQDRLALLERLVTLKDQELAALQRQSAQARGLALPEDGIPTQDLDTTSTDTQKASTPKEPKIDAPAKPSTELTPLPDPSVVVAPRVVESDDSETHDFIWNNPKVWLVALAVMLVVFVLIWLFVRNMLRGDEEEDDNSELALKLQRLSAQAAAAEKLSQEEILKQAELYEAESEAESTESSNPFSANPFGGPTNLSNNKTPNESSKGFSTQEPQMDEILKEVKVFLNYGRQDHAINFLTRLIENYPDEIKPRLALLRLYFDMRKEQPFADQAQILWDRIGDRTSAEWLEVATMGRKILPDHPLFGLANPYDSTLDFDDDISIDQSDMLTFTLPGEDNIGNSKAKNESVLFEANELDLEDESLADEKHANKKSSYAEPDELEFDDSFSLATDDEQESDSSEEAPDSAATQLDLAKTYIEMGDVDGAVEIIKSVLKQGTPEQINEASRILLSMDNL